MTDQFEDRDDLLLGEPTEEPYFAVQHMLDIGQIDPEFGPGLSAATAHVTFLVTSEWDTPHTVIPDYGPDKLTATQVDLQIRLPPAFAPRSLLHELGHVVHYLADYWDLKVAPTSRAELFAVWFETRALKNPAPLGFAEDCGPWLDKAWKKRHRYSDVLAATRSYFLAEQVSGMPQPTTLYPQISSPLTAAPPASKPGGGPTKPRSPRRARKPSQS